MLKINLMDLKIFVKKIFFFLRQHAFWFTPCLLGLLIIYAGYIFYHYVVNPPKSTTKLSTEETKINMDLYQKVIKRLDQREKILKNELEKAPRDIFR